MKKNLINFLAILGDSKHFSLFYREVFCMADKSLEIQNTPKSTCAKCGKQFENKNGLKQHFQRMHTSKKERKISMKYGGDDNRVIIEKSSGESLTLEEIVIVDSVEKTLPQSKETLEQLRKKALRNL